MRKGMFRLLARLNRALLPKVRPEHLTHLNSPRKLLLAWRYWVTRNALD